jgi:hypothetical protein
VKADTPNGPYTNGSSKYSFQDQAKVDINDLPIRSRQEMVFTDDKYKPVGKPIKKDGVELQASGIHLYSKRLLWSIKSYQAMPTNFWYLRYHLMDPKKALILFF